jgi:multiple sugar transport system ATP-binding protein
VVVEPLGSHLLLTMKVGDQTLKVTTRADFQVVPDQTIYLRMEPDMIRWFDPASGRPLVEGESVDAVR